jgi:hypothetical protein
METKANYLMIGGFVLGVVAFAFLFVYWMSNVAGGGKQYYIVFDGSVAGLTTGSNVGFNGIGVGEVQSLQLDPRVVGRQRYRSMDEEQPPRRARHAGCRPCVEAGEGRFHRVPDAEGSEAQRPQAADPARAPGTAGGALFRVRPA